MDGPRTSILRVCSLRQSSSKYRDWEKHPVECALYRLSCQRTWGHTTVNVPAGQTNGTDVDNVLCVNRPRRYMMVIYTDGVCDRPLVQMGFTVQVCVTDQWYRWGHSVVCVTDHGGTDGDTCNAVASVCDRHSGTDGDQSWCV